MVNKDLKSSILSVVKEYLQSSAYTDQKITDTPKGAFSTVPRKYVTMNGASSARPTSSVVGQFYFDTTLAAGNGKPVWWNGTGFVDATGTYV